MMTIANGILSLSFLGQQVRLSAKTDQEIWCFQKWFRIPVTIEEAGKRVTAWVKRDDLAKQLGVTRFQITSSGGSFETLAQNVKAAGVKIIQNQLKQQGLPQPEQLAEQIYLAQRQRQNLFIPRSAAFPLDVYVNADRKIFLRGGKITDCNCGAVYECLQLGSNARFAVKDVKLADPASPRELEAMKKLQGHPGVLPLVSSSIYKQGHIHHLALFTPRYEMTLEQCKDKLSQKQKKIVGRQILQIAAYLSSKGIHRDISLKNILIDPITLKIQFFDFETFLFDGDEILDLAGTREYFSPEYAKAGNETIGQATTPKVDVWASAIALLELFGVLSKKREATPPKEENWIFSLKNLRNVPLEFLKAIHKMTQISPEKRCTAREALRTACPPSRLPLHTPTFPWKHAHLLRGS